MEQFWWDSITGPRDVVRETICNLAKLGACILVLPPSVPWPNGLHEAIAKGVREDYVLRDLALQEVSGEAVIPSPKEVIIDYSRDRRDRGYRKGYVEVSDFVCKRNLLARRLIWIRASVGDSIAEWIEFCQSWSTYEQTAGAVLLELHGDPSKSFHSNCLVSYSDMVIDSSIRVLCNELVCSKKHRLLAKSRKVYAASMLTYLCAGDAEVADYMANHMDFIHSDPITAYRAASESLNRGNGEGLISHDVYSRLWRAQLESVYPVIEEERQKLVSCYSDAIEEIISKGLQDGFGNSIETPDDVEISTLYWLVHSPDKHFKLYVDNADKDFIDNLRECRNIIAHRKCCSKESLTYILDRGEI